MRSAVTVPAAVFLVMATTVPPATSPARQWRWLAACIFPRHMHEYSYSPRRHSCPSPPPSPRSTASSPSPCPLLVPSSTYATPPCPPPWAPPCWPPHQRALGPCAWG